jgi:hypothetical protein
MVRKSLFSRIFGRGPTNGDHGNGRNGGHTAVAEAEPDTGSPELTDTSIELPSGALFEELKPDPGPSLMAREMPKGEEVEVRIREGIQGISHILTGIDRKIDRQQKNSEELIVTVRKIPEMMKDVPDASKAGLELLATISAVLESQGRSTAELMEQCRDLPAALARMERASHEAALRTRDSVQDAVAAVRGRVDELGAQHETRQQQLLEEFRRQQSDHDRRIERLVKKSDNATRLVVFLIVVVIAALLLVVNAVA